jgi:hypothetical protein
MSLSFSRRPASSVRFLLWGLALWLAAFGKPAQAQAPAWLTVVGETHSLSSFCSTTATTMDAAGNVYLAGRFSGTVTFGAVSLISAGQNDIFIAKWSPATNSFVWAQRAGGPGGEESTGLAVSGSSVYLVGALNGPADFGPFTLNSGSNTGTYVVKLTDAGSTSSFTWAQQVQGFAYPFGVAAAGSSVYVTGLFNRFVEFGGIALSSAGYEDGFIAKLTDAGPTGNFVWAQRLGGSGVDFGRSVAAEGSSIYVTGGFQSPTADFGPTTLTNRGSQDIFVTKLLDSGPTGSFVWTQGAGGASFDLPTAVAVSGPAVYVAGSFVGTGLFGPLTLSSPGNLGSLFVTKLTDAGATASFTWAVQSDGPGSMESQNLAVAGASVYVTGTFSPTLTLGSTTLSTLAPNSLVVAKLTDAGASGRFVWAQMAGTTAAELTSGRGVTVTPTGRVCVVGNADLPTHFGSLTLTDPPGANASFVATLQDVVTATAKPASATTLSVYPSPAHTSVTVPGASAAAELLLTDAVGRVVRQSVGSVLSVRGVAPGLYVLRAAEPGKTRRTARVVVE